MKGGPISHQVERPGSRMWSAVGILGELLITFGVLILLFVVYQLWWTNVIAERAATQVSQDLREQWAVPEPTQTPASEPTPQSQYQQPDFGKAFAFMYLPRLKDKVWGLPILGTVSTSDLAKGLGHYEQTQMPGEKGNFAVAGHRATNGEPLRNVDLIKVGDEVYIETRDAWYVYELSTTSIVMPSEMWVIDPLPGQPGEKPGERLITITTCHPRWASTQRWIWWGKQVDVIDKSTGEVPVAVQAGN